MDGSRWRLARRRRTIHRVATDDEQARRDARWARYKAGSQRSTARFQLIVGSVWVVLAVVFWARDDADSWMRWIYTALAAMYLVAGFFWMRQLRRPLPPVPGHEEAPGR